MHAVLPVGMCASTHVQLSSKLSNTSHIIPAHAHMYVAIVAGSLAAGTYHQPLLLASSSRGRVHVEAQHPEVVHQR